jgi:uncharacterized protein
MSDYLDLYNYRCRMSALYHECTQSFVMEQDPEMILQRFRQSKDALFAQHPQSALDEEQRQHFQGLRYFPYNPALRVPAMLDLAEEPRPREMTLSAQETLPLMAIGQLQFVITEVPVTLVLYWITLYGGGLFLPFRDATCPLESYGGGRYLFDTIKGSTPFLDPGAPDRRQITLDFNYAYNPSCAYNHRWLCPLAPAENHLSVAIRAGEQTY